jgi:hypothetical protein
MTFGSCWRRRDPRARLLSHWAFYVGVVDTKNKFDSPGGQKSLVGCHAMRRAWASTALNDEELPIDVVSEVLPHRDHDDATPLHADEAGAGEGSAGVDPGVNRTLDREALRRILLPTGRNTCSLHLVSRAQSRNQWARCDAMVETEDWIVFAFLCPKLLRTK